MLINKNDEGDGLVVMTVMTMAITLTMTGAIEQHARFPRVLVRNTEEIKEHAESNV